MTGAELRCKIYMKNEEAIQQLSEGTDMHNDLQVNFGSVLSFFTE